MGNLKNLVDLGPDANELAGNTPGELGNLTLNWKGTRYQRRNP